MMAEPIKITAAAAVTTAVQDCVAKALTILNDGFEGRIINGYGIYREPGHRARDLRTVRALIEHAQALMEESRWPTNADYEAAERGE